MGEVIPHCRKSFEVYMPHYPAVKLLGTTGCDARDEGCPEIFMLCWRGPAKLPLQAVNKAPLRVPRRNERSRCVHSDRGGR